MIVLHVGEGDRQALPIQLDLEVKMGVEAPTGRAALADDLALDDMLALRYQAPAFLQMGVARSRTIEMENDDLVSGVVPDAIALDLHVGDLAGPCRGDRGADGHEEVEGVLVPASMTEQATIPLDTESGRSLRKRKAKGGGHARRMGRGVAGPHESVSEKERSDDAEASRDPRDPPHAR
jgi:hypothetical protein